MATPIKNGLRLLYLYGITRPLAAKPKLEAGVDGHSAVEPVRCSDLLCWVSRVDAADFGEQLSSRMEDLEWLAEASVRHQQAVAAIHQHGAILPARFGTVFLSDKSLCKDVADRKEQLESEFEFVADADEWGVRVFAIPQAVPLPPKSASGKDYLKQKAASLKEKASHPVGPEVTKLAGELQKIARSVAPGGKVSAGQRGLEWQGSFLVAHSREKAFQGLLAKFVERWQGVHRLECTGPWPPYSFIGRSNEAAGGRG